MRITVEYEEALTRLLQNSDFKLFLSWVGRETELANQLLIYNQDKDIKVLRGRTQALCDLIKAIDDHAKKGK